MKIQLFFTLIIFTMVVACNQTQKSTPDQWSENELNEWFNKGEWKQGWTVSPDETINQKEFADQYFRNQARWDKAFKFLHDENLATLAKGRYELEGADLFVNVDEYITKNEEDALFEAPLPRDFIAWLNGFFLKEHRFIKYIYRNNFRKQALNLAIG